MKKLILLVAIAMNVVACGGSQTSTSTTTAETSESLATITVADVAAGLSNGTVRVYDANRQETFNEHHVPGATWVHYENLSAEVLPEDRSQKIVFYCANEQCTASHNAANAAKALGYTDVAVMSAGIEGWIAAGQPVEAATPSETATAN